MDGVWRRAFVVGCRVPANVNGGIEWWDGVWRRAFEAGCRVRRLSSDETVTRSVRRASCRIRRAACRVRPA
jgi:hypothetical protein